MDMPPAPPVSASNAMPSAMSKSAIALIVVALVVAAALGAYYWKVYRPAHPGGPSNTASSPANDLGTQLYQNSQNPIQNKLPVSVAPLPNPLQSLYKNPFQ